MFASNAQDEKASMTLSKEELQWARAVKEAALQDESLRNTIGRKPLSDYDYAQHALFNNGNVKRSLRQIEGLQSFKEEYKITDTVEEGMTLVQQFHEQHPWFLLDISYEQEDFVLVYDYAQLQPSAVRGPDGWRIFLGGFYYTYQMVTSNLRAVRDGLILVGEIEGMGWKHFSVDLLRTFWDHFFQFYPLKMQEVSWMHDSVIGNIFGSLHKSIMGERGNNIRIGVKNEAYGGRLDAMFKVPTPEMAWDRFMAKCQILLTNRFQRYQSYKLPAVDQALAEDESLFREAMEALAVEALATGASQDGDELTDDEASADEPENSSDP